MDHLSLSTRRAIESIVKSKKFASPPSIHVTSGSQAGDGYIAKTAAITITGSGIRLHLFVKYFPDDTLNAQMEMFEYVFGKELYFYEKIFPEMLKFQVEKGIDDVFDNVPIHYPVTSERNGIPPIVLGNLKLSGYNLRDIKETADINHISLVLKTYAKFHAISFAMRDQNPELFKNISSEIVDSYAKMLFDVDYDHASIRLIKDFITTLDPIADKTIIDKCTSCCECLTEFISSIPQFVDEYSAICHSDGWSNNLMFLYDKETGNLIDVKIIDWQVHRIIPPALDAAHVFYGLARKEALKDFESYRMVYYDTLVDYITKLGSDPKKLYPKKIFTAQWKKFAKFGLIMSFSINRVRFICKDDITDLIDNKDGKIPLLPLEFKGKSQYLHTMREIVEHFVQNGFL